MAKNNITVKLTVTDTYKLKVGSLFGQGRTTLVLMQFLHEKVLIVFVIDVK